MRLRRFCGWAASSPSSWSAMRELALRFIDLRRERFLRTSWLSCCTMNASKSSSSRSVGDALRRMAAGRGGGVLARLASSSSSMSCVGPELLPPSDSSATSARSSASSSASSSSSSSAAASGSGPAAKLSCSCRAARCASCSFSRRMARFFSFSTSTNLLYMSASRPCLSCSSFSSWRAAAAPSCNRRARSASRRAAAAAAVARASSRWSSRPCTYASIWNSLKRFSSSVWP
mmetsp:Transcript_5674/g.22005  ORF Transcript_5674/g.22005 Transcript_5674/m.22005 type:complete len:232 (+) Transcript_5674:148-843(+)